MSTRIAITGAASGLGRELALRWARSGARVAVPVFRNQKQGHLVNIASMAGLLAPPGMSSYNVSKTAVVALSETLYGELVKIGASLKRKRG